MPRNVLLTVLIAICGCNEPVAKPTRDAPVPVAEATPSSSSETSNASAVITEAKDKSFPGITVTVPAGWEERPPASEFVQGEFRISGSAGPARLTMSSTGGGIDANLARWRTQFIRGADDPEPKQTTISVGGEDAVILEMHGTFRDGFSGGPPQTGWCLIGAAIPTGPATFFVKLTGPRDTVVAHRDEIEQLVKTARLMQ